MFDIVIYFIILSNYFKFKIKVKTMRYLKISGVLWIAFALAGCASSGASRVSAHRTPTKSTFVTKNILTNFTYSTGGLGGNTPISYQLRAQCKGRKCVPKNINLSFFLQSGSNTVTISSFNLSIQAGKKSYHWRERSWRNIRNATPVVGKIMTVTLSPQQLKQIAESKKVTGALAGLSFQWSYTNRAPMREMLEKMEKPTKQSSKKQD
jgi:hypothetical protein